jgi:predicted RNase H-like nuclease (RuvC/YqgF family)
MDGEVWAKIAGGIAAVGGALYAAIRMVKNDRRDDKVTGAQDAAMMQVIATLREEVQRLTVRLEAVEKQNHMCEERNESLHMEIVDLKKRLHFA